MKEWLRENWIIIVVIAIALVVFFVSRTRINGYKGEIKAKSDSIAVLVSRYHALEDRAAAIEETLSAAVLEISYKDSMYTIIENRLFNQKRSYEKQITDLSHIPTDQLYVDVTRQLDSLSLLW